jgi:hypothetical protein
MVDYLRQLQTNLLRFCLATALAPANGRSGSSEYYAQARPSQVERARIYKENSKLLRHYNPLRQTGKPLIDGAAKAVRIGQLRDGR